MGGGFKSVKFNYDFASKKRATKLEMEVDDKDVEIVHDNKSNALFLDVAGDHLKWSYHFGTKDLNVKYKRDTKLGKLYVSQRIPAHSFEVFPSPKFELSSTLKDSKDFKHKLVTLYDFHDRRGQLEETLEFWDKYKLSFLASTHSDDMKTDLKVKVGKSFMKSVGVGHCPTSGVSLKYEAKPFGLEVEAKLPLKTKVLKTELSMKVPKMKHVELSLDTALPLAGGPSKKAVSTSVKYKF